jgi:preprotein translocase subunit Sec61beta
MAHRNFGLSRYWNEADRHRPDVSGWVYLAIGAAFAAILVIGLFD